MGLYLIASIYKDKKSILGYRMLDTNTNQTADVPVAGLINALQLKKANVENISLEGGKIVGTNGAIDRYAKCKADGTLLKSDKSPLIILNRIGSEGFTVCDYTGKVVKLRDKDVITYAKTRGIANGKIVEADGIEFVSSIIGNYPVIELATQPKEVEKPKEVERPKEVESKSVDSYDKAASILSNEQNHAINQFYHLAKVDKSTDLDWIESTVKSGKVRETYRNQSIYFYLLKEIPISELKIYIPEYAIFYFKVFIQNRLPIPPTMDGLFRQGIEKHRDNLYSILVTGNNESDGVNSLKTNQYNIKKFIGDSLERVNKPEATAKDLDELIKKLIYIEELSRFKAKLNEAIESAGLTLEEVVLTFNYGNPEVNPDHKHILYNAIAALASEKSEDLIVLNTRYLEIDKALEIVRHTNKIEIINDFINEVVRKRSKAPVDSNGSTEIEDKSYNDTKSSNTNTLNSTTKKSTGQKQETEDKDDPVERPSGWSKLKWVKHLLDNNNYDASDTSIIITKDILRRGAKTLTSKQLYRVNQAIQILEQANKKRLGASSLPEDKDKQNNSTIPDSENITYMLDEHPEIENKVNKLISKANSTEMQAVLEKHPKIISICYSISKYRKASTRQLRHVDSALEILNNQ